MSELCHVIIAAEEYLDPLRERAGSAGKEEILTFADANALGALAEIVKRTPKMVTLERSFAASPRGAALIDRINADASLASTVIHIVSHDGEYSTIAARRMPHATQIDWHGTRRAPRFRMKDDTEIQVDGVLVTLIDLSTIGAQVVSKTALKPQQQLRMMLADDLGVVRFNGDVAWAAFEIPQGVTRYRAGIEFKGAEASEVDAFSHRHRRKG